MEKTVVMGLNENITIGTDLVHLLTKEQAWHYRILPKSVSPSVFIIYCDETDDRGRLCEELEILLGRVIQAEPLNQQQITRLLGTYYIKDAGTEPRALKSGQNDDFLYKLIQEAKQLNSSDIHIERYENKCRVRIRIDGLMIERYLVKPEDYPALVNRIKNLADLDISQTRLPQDGRINFNQNGLQFDIRTSVLPTLYGEKVVLRLLNNDATQIDLNTLGFKEYDLENYLSGIRRPNGILLISGPTGSGKTTTLYATLKILNKETRNILTIEDPVEYTLEGINQVQLKESIGFTFASALRTFLRQDPDVIMVGEIRDVDTANMAIRAALTGHLVLSTIHTNSAWATVSRLREMGIPGHLLSDTLNTSVAQRLIRLLCPSCKEGQQFDPALYPRNFKPGKSVMTHFVAKGCEYCHFTGYKGRKAVYEVIPIDRELAEEIKKGNSDVSVLLREKKIGTLAQNALELFIEGLTSISEIFPLLLNN